MTTDKMHIQLTTTLAEAEQGQRLDAALAKAFPDYSRGVLQQWIKAGDVTVNGQVVAKTRHKVAGGEAVVIDATVQTVQSDAPQAIDLDIIFEDEHLLVLNKPVGLVVHPGAGQLDGTLMNALLYHDSALQQLPRAGIVHRLDKDTSGIMVVAKSLEAHNQLTQQMQARQIHREYEAVVNGQLIAGATIQAPIGRHPTKRTQMAVTRGGREAITHYRVAERFLAHTHLSVKLETGRTHQIRVHMAHIKHSIVGDQVYGRRAYVPKGASDELKALLATFSRQALHAKQLALTHPCTGADHIWEAPRPADLDELIQGLRKDSLAGKS